MPVDESVACLSCTVDGIVVPEERGGIDRRRFVSASVAAAAAALLAGCGTGSDDISGPLTGTVTVALAQYPTLGSVGGMAVVTSGRSRIAVVRTGASTFIALSMACPHEGSTIDATTTGFTCPRHGARFDLNGTWLGGQRTSSLRSYATRYDAGAGTVTVG